MILRLSYHRDPRRPLEYAMDARKAPREGHEQGQPQIVASNMTGKSVADLLVEFDRFIAARPYVERPAIHVVLAPHPNDLEKLTPQVRRELIETYLARQGYGIAPYVAVEHWDSGVRHYSIIASRIDAVGDLIQSSWEGRIGRTVLCELEERNGLVRTGPGPGVRAPNRDQIQRRERLKAQGRMEERVTDEIRARVDAVLRPGLTATDFARQLRARDLSLRLRTEKDGHVSGISYGWHRGGQVHAVSGSSLGAAYTWPGLQRLSGLSYDPTRDSIQSLLHPVLEEPSPPAVPLEPTVPTDAPSSPPAKPRPEAVLPALPVELAPVSPPRSSAALEEVLGQLEELRELQRVESALRGEVKELDQRNWAFMQINPDRLDLATHLAGLYSDRGGAVDELENLFEELRRGNSSPGQAVAAVIDRVRREPEVLGTLHKRKTIFGQRLLTARDQEVQDGLRAVLAHATRFLERKVAVEAEARSREVRLAELERELSQVQKRIQRLPFDRTLVQAAIPEIRVLEARTIGELEGRFPRAMKSVRWALARSPDRGLGI
ncbi:MAG TPA: relaxase/mobilization nuclease domain-containing protein [Longimicrobiaceae bacterium]